MTNTSIKKRQLNELTVEMATQMTSFVDRFITKDINGRLVLKTNLTDQQLYWFNTDCNEFSSLFGKMAVVGHELKELRENKTTKMESTHKTM